ncbi:hypothetical protein EGR_04753 [Echinococcus granulosus]|uniref:RRM domain-containing protein n=1 Tax=Echinococcus granulosus TaxID=6210 RepID=W6UH62_ECHGR|nr:hypothetical protein EGR_04753 [Echinococcus granulosus]EUB60371.1 hypothetical protein EGR_04753 [Echinococcus granulosus]
MVMTQKKNRNPNAQNSKANGAPATKILGKKRPREEDSGDDEDVGTKLDAVQVKKLKQMIVEDADDSGSTELDAEEEIEGDSDEDSEEYGDEDDSDHNGDTEDELPEKVVKLANSREKTQHQQTPVKSNQEKLKATAKQSEQKVGVQKQFRVSASNILLFNIPRLNENELHGFLAKRNVHPESISCINSPVALLGFADDAAAKKAVSACSGAAYSQDTLAVVPVTDGDIGMIRSNKNPHPGRPDAPLTCLFVASLPKSITEKEILKVIGIEPKHLRLMTSGPKNYLTNACYIDCNSEDDARKAFQALQNHQFGDVQVKVYLKPQSNFNPVTETSLIVTNVPFSAEIDDVKKQFPSAKKVELTRRGCFMLSFGSAEDRARVLKESEGKIMGGRTLRFITSDKSAVDYPVFVSNIAFAVSADELKAAFPGCRNVFMRKKNGRFNGNAIVYFTTKEAAEAGAKEGAKKELKGRLLKTKVQDQSADPSIDKQSAASPKKGTEKPKPRVENKAKAVLPAQVGSESEEEDDEEDKSGDEEIDEGDSEDDSVGDAENDMVEEGSESVSGVEEDAPITVVVENVGVAEDEAAASLIVEAVAAEVSRTVVVVGREDAEDLSKNNRDLCVNQMSNLYRVSPPVGDCRSALDSRSLCVYDYPGGLSEADLYPLFPAAVSISCQRRGSSSSCLVQFQSDAYCQAALVECQNGKLIGGRPVQARIVPSIGSDHNFDGYSGSGYALADHSRIGPGDEHNPRDYGSYLCQRPDCTLRNLAWSVTEDDLIREFLRAVSVSIVFDGENRSQGATTSDRYNRAGGSGRRRGGGGYGGEGMHLRRRCDDVDGNERRSCGVSNVGGCFAGMPRNSGGRFDRDRRDRSPGHRRTGGSGARITSAVIRRAPGDSSDSDFDNRG